MYVMLLFVCALMGQSVVISADVDEALDRAVFTISRLLASAVGPMQPNHCNSITGQDFDGSDTLCNRASAEYWRTHKRVYEDEFLTPYRALFKEVATTRTGVDSIDIGLRYTDGNGVGWSLAETAHRLVLPQLVNQTLVSMMLADRVGSVGRDLGLILPQLIGQTNASTTLVDKVSEIGRGIEKIKLDSMTSEIQAIQEQSRQLLQHVEELVIYLRLQPGSDGVRAGFFDSLWGAVKRFFTVDVEPVFAGGLGKLLGSVGGIADLVNEFTSGKFIKDLEATVSAGLINVWHGIISESQVIWDFVLDQFKKAGEWLWGKLKSLLQMDLLIATRIWIAAGVFPFFVWFLLLTYRGYEIKGSALLAGCVVVFANSIELLHSLQLLGVGKEMTHHEF